MSFILYKSGENLLKELIPAVFSNGFIFFIPILLWNMALTKKLPFPYGTQSFDSDIPKVILLGEGLFRMIVMLMPLTMKVNLSTIGDDNGIIVFILGVLLYFISWISLILFPESNWSKSVIGFSAPAYTPLVWLIGFAMITTSFYFNYHYSLWYYLIPSFIFISFHLLHTVIIYNRQSKNKI